MTRAADLNVGDTFIGNQNDDLYVVEKDVEINGQIGLLVNVLGKGKQERKYLDPDQEVTVTETADQHRERRERFENTVGDATDAHYQTMREKRMGL